MSKEPPTKISSINIIVHPALPSNETRIVSRQSASQLPAEIRDDVTFPCIVTGNLDLTDDMITLMVAQTLSEYLDAKAERQRGSAVE